MKTANLCLIAFALVIGSSAFAARSVVRSQPLAQGNCKRVLYNYNKYDRAYRTVCNSGFFQSVPKN